MEFLQQYDIAILFLISAVAWFGLEFLRVFQGRATISGRVWNLRTKSPTLGMLISLGVGMLWAHFFWGQCGPF